MKKPFLFLLAALLLLTATSCTPTAPAGGAGGLPVGSTSVLSINELPPVLAADERLAPAAAANRDTVAWLTIPGTTIDGAVQQSADNDYYLRRDEQGSYNLGGCYFADYECNFAAGEVSRNTIIYGHYFTDDPDAYFGQLWQLANDSARAAENRTIYLSVADKMLEYQIISIGVANAADDTLAINASPTTAELQDIINMATERSIYAYDFSPASCKNILTLSTCTDDPATRLLVVAVLKNNI